MSSNARILNTTQATEPKRQSAIQAAAKAAESAAAKTAASTGEASSLEGVGGQEDDEPERALTAMETVWWLLTDKHTALLLAAASVRFMGGCVLNLYTLDCSINAVCFRLLPCRYFCNCIYFYVFCCSPSALLVFAPSYLKPHLSVSVTSITHIPFISTYTLSNTDTQSRATCQLSSRTNFRRTPRPTRTSTLMSLPLAGSCRVILAEKLPHPGLNQVSACIYLFLGVSLLLFCQHVFLVWLLGSIHWLLPHLLCRLRLHCIVHLSFFSRT